MAMLPIVKAPNPILRKMCEDVTAIDSALRQFMDDMLETMYKNYGVGLAAPQVASLHRIIVLDVSEKQNEPYQLINPRITWQSEEWTSYTEGCLSFGDERVSVSRPTSVRVSYMDPHGAMQEIEGQGLMAVCLQHEIDHLNGKLFIDELSKTKQRAILEARLKTL